MKDLATVQANFTENMHVSSWVNEYKEFILTVHNFHQFGKVEWNKLVRAEIEARKYVLGQQRTVSNEQQMSSIHPN